MFTRRQSKILIDLLALGMAVMLFAWLYLMQVQIEKVQAEIKEVKKDIQYLVDKTHPSAMIRDQFDWIMGRYPGSEGRVNSKWDSKN